MAVYEFHSLGLRPLRSGERGMGTGEMLDAIVGALPPSRGGRGGGPVHTSPPRWAAQRGKSPAEPHARPGAVIVSETPERRVRHRHHHRTTARRSCSSTPPHPPPRAISAGIEHIACCGRSGRSAAGRGAVPSMPWTRHGAGHHVAGYILDERRGGGCDQQVDLIEKGQLHDAEFERGAQ